MCAAAENLSNSPADAPSQGNLYPRDALGTIIPNFPSFQNPFTAINQFCHFHPALAIGPLDQEKGLLFLPFAQLIIIIAIIKSIHLLRSPPMHIVASPAFSIGLFIKWI